MMTTGLSRRYVRNSNFSRSEKGTSGSCRVSGEAEYACGVIWRTVAAAGALVVREGVVKWRWRWRAPEMTRGDVRILLLTRLFAVCSIF